MTRYLFLLLFCSIISSFSLAQGLIEWTDSVHISNSANYSASVEVLGDGTPVVAFGQGIGIFFSIMDGDTFSSPIQLNTSGNNPDIFTFGGIDLATFENNIYIVFESFNNGIFVLKSNDRGITFNEPVNVISPEPGKWATLPTIATDQNGHPIVSVIYENTNETDAEYFFIRSNNFGDSFQEPVLINTNSNGNFVCECCPSSIQIKENDIYVAYRNNDNNLRDIWVAKSADNGVSFDTAIDIDASDWVLGGCPISGPRVTSFSTDSLISTWMSAATGTGTVYFSTFNSNTMDYGYEVAIPVSNENATQSSPDIAGQNDTIGMVWDESNFGDNGSEILFRYSISGSDGIKLAETINISNAAGFDRRPSIQYDRRTFHIVYSNSSGALIYTSAELAITVDIKEENDVIPIEFESVSYINNHLYCTFSGVYKVENVTVRLYNTDGRQIANLETKLTPHSNLQLETPQLADGFYFMFIEGSNFRLSSGAINVK